MELERVRTNHENPMLLYQGFTYQKNKPNENGTRIWRCSEATGHSKCSSSLTLSEDCKVITRQPSEHNHSQLKPVQVAANKMKRLTKKRTQENPRQKTKVIFDAERSRNRVRRRDNQISTGKYFYYYFDKS
jgi:hypothetical protein